MYDSSDDEEYSYGWDDFKMQVEALGMHWQLTLTRIQLIHCNSIDHSKPPIQPLAKVLGEKLSISQEITPRAPRIDMGSRRRVSHDEDMFKIDEGTVSSLLN